MPLRVATVFAGIPNPWQSGGPLTHWGLISALLDAGHTVTFFGLPWDEPPSDARVHALRALGAHVVLVPPARPRRAPQRWRRRVDYARSVAWPNDETLFPSTRHGSNLDAAVRAHDPEVVVAHGTDAATAGVAIDVPKVALVSDPPGFSRRLRTRWDPQYPWRFGRDELVYRVASSSFAFRADRRFVDLLRRFESVGVFGAHRAERMRRAGIRAWYARSPIVDAAGSDWLRRRAAAQPNAKPRILLIGHLRGVSTISGLHVLVGDVLPRLDQTLGRDAYEVHVVGAHDPPSSLRRPLEHPAVHLRGHIEPPDDEFLRADVLLVPTPVETGPRVRILTGFSFGCCVVAHHANSLGIPALAHGVNALLASAGDLAGATVTALRDAALRQRLGAEGRLVYESLFAPEQAGRRIIAELERVAGRR